MKKSILILIIIILSAICFIIGLDLTGILSLNTIIKKEDTPLMEQVDEYVNQLVNKNIIKAKMPDEYTLYKSRARRIKEYRVWKYENGYLMSALYQTGKYNNIVHAYYENNLMETGEINDLTMPNRFVPLEVDLIQPAVLLFDLGDNPKYKNGIEFIHYMLSIQPTLKNCGDNYTHKVYNSQWKKYTFSLDGLYMALPFYLKYTHDYKGVFKRMDWVAKNLKLENNLYSHGTNCKINNKIVWLRAAGWYAMAQVDLIEQFPDSKEKNIMKKQLIDFLDALLKYQDENTGMWHNVIYPETESKCNRLETSGSLMLSYTLLKAYNLGIVKDEKYKEAGLKAFNGTVSENLKKNIIGQYYLKDILYSSKVEDTPEKYCVCKNYVKDDAKGAASLILAAQQVKLLSDDLNSSH